MFLPKYFFCNSIRDWTNQKIGAAIRSKQYISSTEILAIVGLDIASSLVPMNPLRDLWSDKPFSSSRDFNQVMGRDPFLKIRSHLTFCMPDEGKGCCNVLSSNFLDDPLYTTRSILE